MIFPVFVFSAGSYEVRYRLEPISKSHFLLFLKGNFSFIKGEEMCVKIVH